MMTYNVIVEVKGQQFARLGFTDKRIAENEFNRIKAAGAYGGSWITNIQFIEEPLKQAALLKPKKDKETTDE
jgi:hypothetical protein